MRLTIRRKLTLWNTLAFACVLFAFAALIYLLLARVLLQQTDRLLDAGFQLLAADPRLHAAPQERLDYWIDEFKEHQNLYCAVFRPDGSLYAHHPELEPALLAAREVAAERAPGPRTVRGPEGARWRSALRPVAIGGEEYRVLLVAPLREVDRELATVLRILLLSGPAAVLLSGLVAYGLARTALAPVEAIRRSTDAITAERLDRRLPVPNPHDELGRLSTTINAMIARLERSFAQARRFTADASHELRTPLTAIRTEAEVALASPTDAEAYQQLLGSILEECGRMTRLTDQLLTLAREDAGAAAAEAVPVDLGQLAREVVETLRPLAAAKGLRVRAELGEGVTVAGDAVRLRQVLLNLLDNAIKYTPEGGTVTARVGRQGQEAVVTVADTGEGIPPEHLPHVFERFYRVDKARSREMGGTGLGLSIAKSIVTAHGGRIGLRSSPGAGTTCTVALPLAPPAAAGAEPDRGGPPPPAPG
ncbi:MAG TPA: heavy metal sensor histidine kinase [Gemmataceae bacterium]